MARDERTDISDGTSTAQVCLNAINLVQLQHAHNVHVRRTERSRVAFHCSMLTAATIPCIVVHAEEELAFSKGCDTIEGCLY
eukprot:3352171-Amphidinium_carterae.2